MKPVSPDERYPEGHFVGMWIGLGIATFCGVGVPLAIVTKSFGLIGLGPAVGVAFGVAVGGAIEDKHRRQGRIRPLSAAERMGRRRLTTWALVSVLIGVALFVVLLLR
jgi:hypothetical protein